MQRGGNSSTGTAMVQDGMDGSQGCTADEVIQQQDGVEAGNEEEGAIMVASPDTAAACLIEGLHDHDESSERGDIADESSEEFRNDFNDPSVMVPTVGQLFKEDADAYSFYNLYARFIGFGIRLSRNHYRKSDNVKTMQEYCCNREGNNRKAKDQENRTRIGCKAMLRVHRSSEQHQWRVTAFEPVHNHGMKRGYNHTSNFRSHSHIDDGTKRILAEMVDKGIPRSNMYGFVSGLHGGPSLAPFTRKAVNRVVYSIRKDECSDDVQKTLDYFKELQLHSRNFFYTVQVDTSTRVKDIFWAHASSRLSYDHFGDVVTFDTTYRTNRYNMPFGIFVGVNNHFQTVVFGCALLREETVEAFKWLFKTFSKAMNGKEPASILTDNCHQMEVAIREVWPNAIHRVCKWHVLKKAKENLGNIYSRKRSKFKDDFHEAINLTNTPDEFERAWKAVRDKYELNKSVFLDRMWDMKEKWAPAYFKDFFFAKMSTTQRSESMNHALKRYVNPSASLNGFVRRYETFYYDRIQAENTEDFYCFNGKVSTTTSSPIERHAAAVYTRGAFNKFKEQFCSSFCFIVQDTSVENEVRVVYIGDNFKKCWGRDAYEVHANIIDCEFSCVCKLFQHLGILCSHILLVLVHNGFKEIPEKYILKRWRKDARDGIPDHLDSVEKDNKAMESRVNRHARMHELSLALMRIGDTSLEASEMAIEGLSKLIDSMKVCSSPPDSSANDRRRREGVGRVKPINLDMDETTEDDERHSEDRDDCDFTVVCEDGVGTKSTEVCEEGDGNEGELIPETEIQPPELRRGRGRPKVARHMSNCEKATIKKKKEDERTSATKKVASASSAMSSKKMQIRYCKKCGESGHNSTTCGRESSYKRKNLDVKAK